MSLIHTFEFPRFKQPKTKRCKTLILHVGAHTFTALSGMYGVKLGCKYTKFFSYLPFFTKNYLNINDYFE